jgi:hypothetical protein
MSEIVPEPVIDVPAWSPTSPSIVVAPVLVTVVWPKTAKLSAVPKDWSAAALAGPKAAPRKTKPAATVRDQSFQYW